MGSWTTAPPTRPPASWRALGWLFPDIQAAKGCLCVRGGGNGFLAAGTWQRCNLMHGDDTQISSLVIYGWSTQALVWEDPHK